MAVDFDLDFYSKVRHIRQQKKETIPICHPVSPSRGIHDIVETGALNSPGLLKDR